MDWQGTVSTNTIAAWGLRLALLMLFPGWWSAGSSRSFASAQELDEQRASRPLLQIEGAPLPGPHADRPLEEQPDVQTHCAAARELIEQQKFPEAVVELNAALNRDGGCCYEVLYLLAQAKRGVGRWGEARLAAELASVYRPGAADVHLFLGRLHRDQRRPEFAIAHFRTAALAAEVEPDNPHVAVAWYELGECLAEAGYLTAAVESFERFDHVVWEERPAQQSAEAVASILRQRPYGALDRRLELLRRLGQADELARTAERAYRTRPEEPYLERLYVRTLLEAGQAEPAFDFCRERLAASPAGDPRSDVRLTLAIETGSAAGRLSEWVAQLAADVTRDDGAELARRVAERLDAAGDHALSLALWRPLAEAHPNDAGTAWALAGACRESGDLAGAVRSLIAFVRANPDGVEIPPEPLAAWTRSFAATEELLRLVHELSAGADSDAATSAVLGSAAAAAGQAELAEQLFRAALEQRPDFVLVHLAWARMALADYQWDAALAHAERALTIAPDSPAAQHLRGQAFAGLDRQADAEQAFKAAAAARPEQVAYVLELARHYRRTGNLLAAQRYFQQAWSADRSLGEAVEELIDCYLEGGKVEIARACLKEAEASDVPDDVLRRARTALRFAAAPMQAEHLAELTQQFAQYPDDIRTGLKLAAGLYLHQRVDEALPVLEQVQARAPDDERLTFLLARVQLRRMKNEAAIGVLEQAARRFPNRQGVLRLLADAYLADFRVEEARQVLQRLLALEVAAEQRQQLREYLLNTYLWFSEFDAALDAVAQWQASEPAETSWGRVRLQVLLTAERADEAVAYATERLEAATARLEESQARGKSLSARLREDPKDADARAQLQNLERELETRAAELYERRVEFVRVCLGTQRLAMAEEQVRAWLAEDPEPAEWLEWLIEVLLAAERGDAALEAVGELMPKTPADVIEAFTWRARARALTGDLQQGLDELNSLLEEGFVQSDPRLRAQVRGEILTLLVEASEHDRALALCDRWLAGIPAQEREARLGVLTLKRRVLSTADRLEEQLEVLEELLAAQPNDPGLNNDLGYTWIDRGQHLERGLAMIKLAVAADPLNAAFLDSLGWAYYKSGDFPGARLHLSRAVRLRSGQDPVLYDHLGDAEYRAGDPDAARAAWEQALTLLTTGAPSDATPRDTHLIAALRGKLSALAESARPAVAPTADEQEAPQP